MNSHSMTIARSRGTGTGRPPAHQVRGRILVALGGAVVALAACSDSNIPFYTAPTTVPASPQGVQNAVTGIFAASRTDIPSFATSIDYGRDASVFTNTEPRTVTYPTGVQQTPNTSGGLWANEYTWIRQAQQVLAVLPKVGYFPDSLAAVTGVVQTLEAYNYMTVLEAHDTLGMAIQPAGNLSAPPPAVCLVDGWKYIVALLDSADVQLETAGAIQIPLTLPVSFQGVKIAGPGSVNGTFASLNRVLAAKANLELAYSVGRLPPIKDSLDGPDNPAFVATPYAPAVTQAQTDLTLSGMFTGGVLAPATPPPFVADANNVLWDYSSASGDVSNNIFSSIGTQATLKDFVASVDTVNDLRWKTAFIKNPNNVQQPQYAVIANITKGGTTWSYVYNMSNSPSAPIPLVTQPDIVLLEAQIELGLGNFGGAIATTNLVRTAVGGLPAASPPATYIGARDFVLSEQRVTAVYQTWNIRTISLRMYGLAILADTTWNNPGPPPRYSHSTTGTATAATQEAFPQQAYLDWHTLVNPIPFTELTGRGEQNTGILVTTCSGTP